MMYLNTFLYYTFFSSVILIYGVGINRIAEIGVSQRNDILFFLKIIFTILSSSLITWVIISKILAPLKLIELYPIIAFLVFSVINILFESMVRIISNKSSSEFIITYLIILLSVTESTSIINTLIICASAILSFLIIAPFCFTFKSRVMANGNSINEKYYSLFFIFLAIIILLSSVYDIVWINPGVMQ